MTAVATKPTAANKVVLKKIVERLDPPTLGATIDKMYALREDKRALDAKIKTIESEMKELEITMFGQLDAQETTKSQGKKASVSITETVVGNVEDWETFWPYIAKNKFWHLVQKRVSDPGLRELWALKKKTPGVVPFTKRTLNLRSL